ncbi:hypothetical protein T484DRAFT_3567268 [Baffinella frigidus]|nr:hypothetical protein T484DRAFT_3567268 [Cryptophyta sp. CCMP2293]
MNGIGNFNFPNGDKYAGAFENDLPHGEGKYQFANGTIYEGQFHAGRMHGEGKFSFPETAAYDHDEYLPPGMTQPDRLRIPVCKP